MPFIPISENLWPAIYALQTQVYDEIEPESIEVLRSKWLCSPHCCFAYIQEPLITALTQPKPEPGPQVLSQDQPQPQVKAYILAHTIDTDVSGSIAPPILHQPLCLSFKSSSIRQSLFLHDLSVATELKGTGVGQRMVTQLLSIAMSLGYQQVLLVAIQGSVPFWLKMGFELDNTIDVKTASEIEASYGKGATVMRMRLAI